MALPEGFQSWKRGFCPFAMWESSGEREGLGFSHIVFLGGGSYQAKICVSAQAEGRTYPPWTSVPAWGIHHNTPAGLPAPGCLGDPLPPVGPYLLPVGPPVTHGIPFPSCLEKAFPGCSKPQESEMQRGCKVQRRSATGGPSAGSTGSPAKQGQDFPYGECRDFPVGNVYHQTLGYLEQASRPG